MWTYRIKVLQLVDLYAVAVTVHDFSYPVVVIPTHKLPTVTSSINPRSPATNTAPKSCDVLVEYTEPVTPRYFIH